MKEELLKYHAESWGKVKETTQTNLPLPFLEVCDPRQAWTNFDKSLENETHNPSDEELLDVPKNMVLIYQGTFVPLNFAYGGILVPEKCLEDEIEQTKAALTHEQVHDALQGSSFIYGLSFIFASQPEIHNVFNNFIEFMAHIYAARTMEKQGMPCEKYYEVPVIYTRRVREQFGMKNEMSREEEVKQIIKQHEDFYKEIKDVNPITNSFECFATFMRGYTPPNIQRACVQLYGQLLKTPKMIRRRRLDDRWTTITPLALV